MDELNCLPVELRAPAPQFAALRRRWFGSSVVGIDVGVDMLRACCVRRVPGGTSTIIAHARVALPYTVTLDAALENHEAFCDAARTLYRMLTERGMPARARAVIGVRDPDAVLVRRMQIPLGEVMPAVREQLARVLPPSGPAVCVGWERLQRVSGVHEHLDGTMAAIDRERVVALQRAFTAAAFPVMAIEPSAWGLRRVMRDASDTQVPELCIDIGAAVTALVVFRGGDILCARDIALGTDRFGRVVRDALAASETADRATLEAMLVPEHLEQIGITSTAAQEAAVACGMELYEAYLDLQQEHQFPDIADLVLSGVGSRIDLVRRVVSSAFAIAAEPSLLDPPDFLNDRLLTEAERAACTAAVGHALRTDDGGLPAIVARDQAHAVTRDGVHILPPPSDPYRASRRELQELFSGLEALCRAGVIRAAHREHRREFADVFGRFSGDRATGSRKFRRALSTIAMEIRSSDVSWARALRRHILLPPALAHCCDHIAAHPGDLELAEVFGACVQFLTQRRSTAESVDALLARVPNGRGGS